MPGDPCHRANRVVSPFASRHQTAIAPTSWIGWWLHLLGLTVQNRHAVFSASDGGADPFVIWKHFRTPRSRIWKLIPPAHSSMSPSTGRASFSNSSCTSRRKPAAGDVGIEAIKPGCVARKNQSHVVGRDEPGGIQEQSLQDQASGWPIPR